MKGFTALDGVLGNSSAEQEVLCCIACLRSLDFIKIPYRFTNSIHFHLTNDFRISPVIYDTSLRFTSTMHVRSHLVS